MDGLTNIIAKIEQQNEVECNALVESARAEADKILSDAKSEAERIKSEILETTDAKAEIINSKAVSSSLIEYKRAVLQKKSSIIDEVIAKALERLLSADDKTYFGYIETLIKSNAADGKGSVKMSDKDIKRLPVGFEEKINSLLGDGKSVEFSKTPAEINGGFIIEYPEMRIDCTFASLIDDKNDEIRDEINKILFS